MDGPCQPNSTPDRGECDFDVHFYQPNAAEQAQVTEDPDPYFSSATTASSTISPTRSTIHSSPLRNSVSYDEPPEVPPKDKEPRPTRQLTFELSRPPTAARTSMPYTGDGSPRSRAWYSRARESPSTPVQSPAAAAEERRARSQSTTPRNINSISTSPRFGFLDAFRGSPNTHADMPPDEELTNMDVEKALFPQGLPSDEEVFSPAAFKNLQMTATGLLRKYQTAYRFKTDQFREMREEHEEQAHQNGDAQQNIQILKDQLERMAQKASEQESIMQALMTELNQEKRIRMEQLDRGSHDTPKASTTHQHDHHSVASESASEDLCVEQDQKARSRSRRATTMTMKSDTSFDTDEESVEETSVFSRSRSPTICTTFSDLSTDTCAPSSSSIVLPNPTMTAVHPRSPLPSTPPTSTARTTPTRTSTASSPPNLNPFQKLWKGKVNPEAGAGNGCRNCQGQDASVAWDTVNLLRDENKGLKQRVGDLEEAVDGALDAVHGIKLGL